jgi:trehalose synthase
VFAGRAIWQVNSTARGGGVVELLLGLLGYARAAGVDNRWVVIEGNEDFFRVTKRIHNNLHGFAGDGRPLGDAQRHTYESTLEANARELRELLRPGDVVYMHDPQTAGLIPKLRDLGVTLVWRCHVGLDLPDDCARRAWDFLRPYVEHADAFVFSRREFAWEGLDPSRVWVVPPSIDVFSPKNQDLDEPVAHAILQAAGIAVGAPAVPPVFTRDDGSPGRVDTRAELLGGRPLRGELPVVTQVSRWDRLKDPAGVMTSLADRLAEYEFQVVLAGPAAAAVADDPEGQEVLEELVARRQELPSGIRDRALIASLPMDDVEENAAIVNALQRASTVVVQKSIAEGFGLTVAEAMWKGRPVVASRRGGIQDQIVDGESGILLDDPRDLRTFGDAVLGLLRDPERARRMGEAARQRVIDNFLGTRHLLQYLALLADLPSVNHAAERAGKG